MLSGTITNTGPTALKNIGARTKDGLCLLAARQPAASRLEPGQTVKVYAVIDPEIPPTDDMDPNDARLRAYGWAYPGSGRPLDPSRLWDLGDGLAVGRSDRIQQWITQRDDLACVYAEVESADPAAKLVGRQAIEQHWKVVRALVVIKREK
jgi:hypothetical protein